MQNKDLVLKSINDYNDDIDNNDNDFFDKFKKVIVIEENAFNVENK